MPDWFDKQTLGDLLNSAADRFRPPRGVDVRGAALDFRRVPR